LRMFAVLFVFIFMLIFCCCCPKGGEPKEEGAVACVGTGVV
jgi:hypothetical protein